MTDPTQLWNFDDPAGSEQRLREAADVAEGADRLVLLSQVARALGLQGEYDEANAVLDQLAANDPEVATRVSLERGRLLRSAGEPEAAVPHFEAAERTAAGTGAVALQVDATHMLGLVHADAGRFEEALVCFEQALAASEPTGDPERTRVARWTVAWALRNLGRTDEALALQRSIKAELEAAGRSDPHVDEELALLEG